MVVACTLAVVGVVGSLLSRGPINFTLELLGAAVVGLALIILAVAAFLRMLEALPGSPQHPGSAPRREAPALQDYGGRPGELTVEQVQSAVDEALGGRRSAIHSSRYDTSLPHGGPFFIVASAERPEVYAQAAVDLDKAMAELSGPEFTPVTPEVRQALEARGWRLKAPNFQRRFTDEECRSGLLAAAIVEALAFYPVGDKGVLYTVER